MMNMRHLRDLLLLGAIILIIALLLRLTCAPRGGSTHETVIRYVPLRETVEHTIERDTVIRTLERVIVREVRADTAYIDTAGVDYDTIDAGILHASYTLRGRGLSLIVASRQRDTASVTERDSAYPRDALARYVYHAVNPDFTVALKSDGTPYVKSKRSLLTWRAFAGAAYETPLFGAVESGWSLGGVIPLLSAEIISGYDVAGGRLALRGEVSPASARAGLWWRLR